MPSTEKASLAGSAWSPLAQPVFRSLWAANTVSNIGTWMHEVGEAWLMTTLTVSPLLVALLQAVDSLSGLLLALPSGALADVIDRRKLLIFTQAWMLAAAAGLGIVTLMGIVTPGLLLLFTFLLGVGSAMNAPAWQATIPDVVPLEDLTAAVTLNSLSFNMGRVAGPALGGLVVAALGTGNVFLLNAASFLGVIWVLERWRREPGLGKAPAERIVGAMASGLRYVRHAPRLHAVYVRAGMFILGASALWSLAPVLARRELGMTAVQYGVLLGSLGLGAVTAATVLARLRRAMPVNRLASAATLVFALGMAGLAFSRGMVLACVSMLAAGLGWLSLMSTFQALVQLSVPGWVRARALSAYLVVFHLSRALGSTLWGAVAQRAGVRGALAAGAAALAAGLLAGLRYELRESEKTDIALSPVSSEPSVSVEPHPDHGPVLVTIEYEVEPRRAAEFAEAMRALGGHRRRDGAFEWGFFQDAADPRRFVETFMVESWAEHLRQHKRGTVAGRAAVEKVRSFHVGDRPPEAAHWLAAENHLPGEERR